MSRGRFVWGHIVNEVETTIIPYCPVTVRAANGQVVQVTFGQFPYRALPEGVILVDDCDSECMISLPQAREVG